LEIQIGNPPGNPETKVQGTALDGQGEEIDKLVVGEQA